MGEIRTIKIYGRDAEGIENDMIFVAVVKSVEGRKVAELKLLNDMRRELAGKA